MNNVYSLGKKRYPDGTLGDVIATGLTSIQVREFMELHKIDRVWAHCTAGEYKGRCFKVVRSCRWLAQRPGSVKL